MPLRLPSILSSNAVVQCNVPVRIWGEADPGSLVDVQLGDRRVTCVADPSGQWRCEIPAFPPGRELTLAVACGAETHTAVGILTGEVWLCSGQSNMEMEVDKTYQFDETRNDADYPAIRCFTAEHARAADVANNCAGAWKVCNSATVGSFSGVAFHFARQVHRELRIPVGVVVCAVGATSVKQWISRDALAGFPQYADLVKASYDGVPGPCVDPGITPVAKRWHEPAFDDATWHTVRLPFSWYAAGLDFNGAAWFRKRFDVPLQCSGKECTLSLGKLNDFDITFVNGVRIGATDASTPWWWNTPRYYRIPAGTLRPQGNVIAFRLFNQWDDGGVVETEKDRLSLQWPDGSSVSLKGEWRYAAEIRYPPRPVTTAQPCGHFHAMIAPLTPMRLRGFVWYQGENDVAFVEDHRTLFPALIRDWRQKWGAGDLPFLFVQLPKYAWPAAQPGHGCLPYLREAQSQALCLPNTAMAVALDAGEANDVHPQNKRDVGVRLGLLALNRVYGKNCEDQGPCYAGILIEQQRIRIRFTHADGLHAVGEMAGFEVAGEDRRFHAARARIEGTEIVAESEAVPAPVAVRYAWSDCPPHPLYNAARLPAAPLRSDRW